MKRPFRVHLMLGLLIPLCAGCASQPAFRPFSPDPQSVAQRRVKDTLVSMLRNAGRDPIGCSLYFFDSRNLGAFPLWRCMFAVTTGVVNTRDERFLSGLLAASVAIEVLGWTDTEESTRRFYASRALTPSQMTEMEKKAAEILTQVGDPDPAGTLRYTDTRLRNERVVEPWPAGWNQRVSHEKVMAALVPLVPGVERPAYVLGQTWRRSDGDYRLTRIERDTYVFAGGPDQEIHLTHDLMIRAAKQGSWATEFESLPRVWPLVVGKWGTSYGVWKVPSEPRPALVGYMWTISAYEEVQVPAGTFKAFRIVLEWESNDPNVRLGRRRLVSWYAPAVRQLVKAEFTEDGPLNFQVLAVDQPTTDPPVASPTPGSAGTQ